MQCTRSDLLFFGCFLVLLLCRNCLPWIVWWGFSSVLCCVLFVLVSCVECMLYVSVDCLFLISPSVFSNVYVYGFACLAIQYMYSVFLVYLISNKMCTSLNQRMKFLLLEWFYQMWRLLIIAYLHCEEMICKFRSKDKYSAVVSVC